MNKNLQILANAIGLNPDHLKNALEAEEGSFDVAAISKEFKAVQASIIRKELESDYDKKLQENFGTARIKFMSDLNKNLSLGYNNSDIKGMDYDAFLKESVEKVERRVNEHEGQTDEELTKKYNSLVTQLDQVTQGYESKITDIKTTLQEKISAAQREAEKYIVDSEFSRNYSKFELGVLPEHREVWGDRIKNDILSKYKVNADGSLTDKDGNAAVNFTGNGVYTKIEEPIAFLVDKYKIAKVSGGNDNKPPVKPGVRTSDDKSQQYNDMRTRFAEKGANV